MNNLQKGYDDAPVDGPLFDTGKNVLRKWRREKQICMSNRRVITH
jgi:hypothetical protein